MMDRWLVDALWIPILSQTIEANSGPQVPINLHHHTSQLEDSP